MSSSLMVAEAYYTAMANKNMNDMKKYLHPQIHFLSPLTTLTSSQDVLEAATRLLSFFKSMTIREKFNSANQAMIVFDLDCPEPIGLLRSASLLTVENNLITRIELFFDARSFDTLPHSN